MSLALRFLGYPVAFLLVAAAVLVTVWHYRGVVPGAPGWIGRALTALRITAFALLVAALAEPVLRIISTVVRRESTIVLLDTSASMDIPLDPSRKQAALDAFSRARERIGDSGLYYTFDGSLAPAGDAAPSFSGSGTDIATAVKTAVSREGTASVVLISDGRWNLGEDPETTALRPGIPVHSILAGATVDAPEFALSGVSASPVAYEGKDIAVEVTVTSSRSDSEPVDVAIFEGTRQTATGKAVFSGGRMARVTLEFPPGPPGSHMLTAVINPGEDTVGDNNARSFRVQVLKSTFTVLLVAGKPSSDLSFVRRELEADPAFEVDVMVATGLPATGNPAFGIGEADAVSVFDGGGAALDRTASEAIIARTESGAGLWLAGSAFEGAGARTLLDAAPVTAEQGMNRDSGEFFVAPTEDGAMHFLTAGIVDHADGGWETLPPLRSVFPLAGKDGEGRVLAIAGNPSREGGGHPALIAGRRGAGKVIVMPVSGFWRWKLMMAGAGRESAFFSAFVRGTVRWLTSETETSPLTIATDSGSYLSGQEITFEGRLFDRVYMPVPGADVSIVIDNDPARKVFLEETSPAVYTGSIRGMEPGEHRFDASAFMGSARFAETSGTFRVERSSLETLDTTPSPETLASLAGRTGGMHVTAAGADSVFDALKQSTITEREEREAYLALHPSLPFVIVSFLALEWALRKRRGML